MIARGQITFIIIVLRTGCSNDLVHLYFSQFAAISFYIGAMYWNIFQTINISSHHISSSHLISSQSQSQSYLISWKFVCHFTMSEIALKYTITRWQYTLFTVYVPCYSLVPAYFGVIRSYSIDIRTIGQSFIHSNAPEATLGRTGMRVIVIYWNIYWWNLNTIPWIAYSIDCSVCPQFCLRKQATILAVYCREHAISALHRLDPGDSGSRINQALEIWVTVWHRQGQVIPGTSEYILRL